MAFLAGYNRRQKITIDSDSYISGDLSSQAIAVHIPDTNTDFWANDDGVGTYVRFTTSDGETLLDFEVESYDSGGEDAWWHVEIPTLLSATDTEIYIYYDADSTSDGSDREGTWDANYKTSYRLNQDKAEGAFDDSTSNNNNLTNTGTTDAAGQIDRGRNFDGLNDDLRLPDDALNALTSGTLEWWVDKVTDAVDTLFIGSLLTATTDYIAIWIGADKKIAFQCRVGDVNQYLGSVDVVIDDSTPTHIEWDKTGSTHIIRINGVSETINFSVETDKSKYFSDLAGAGTIGYTIGNFRRNTNSHYYKGILDEITISDDSRSDDWTKARVQSGLGTWLSFGAEEILVAPSMLPLLGAG